MNPRLIAAHELQGLLQLYTHLHGNPMPEETEELRTLWREMLADPHHRIVVLEQEEQLVSSCVLAVIPNLTHGQRPYALVENVVTHPDFRGKGYATACLSEAKRLAMLEGCYKIMLMTGSKRESTLCFYERAGYNRQDKTAFIQWLEEDDR